MTAASASHRLLNFVQSALLLGLMAAIAWISVTAVVGPETGLLMALAMVGGLLFAPALPRRLLLSAYQAQRLTGRDAPGLVAALAELARRAGLQRAPALYRVPSRLPNARCLGRLLSESGGDEGRDDPAPALAGVGQHVPHEVDAGAVEELIFL